jgi:hypothetical protein
MADVVHKVRKYQAVVVATVLDQLLRHLVVRIRQQESQRPLGVVQEHAVP